jgi:hypothetical protein
MFRIYIDKEGKDGTLTNCILLNRALSFDADAEQVMFDIPYFKIENYAHFKIGEAAADEDEAITRNRPFHVFVVRQMTYAY